LTIIGAEVFVSTGFLTTVSGAMIEGDFFGVGEWVSLVDKVMSGPCSTGSELTGRDGVVAVAVDGAALAGGGTADAGG
jgi:hypothetical protein